MTKDVRIRSQVDKQKSNCLLAYLSREIRVEQSWSSTWDVGKDQTKIWKVKLKAKLNNQETALILSDQSGSNRSSSNSLHILGLVCFTDTWTLKTNSIYRLVALKTEYIQNAVNTTDRPYIKRKNCSQFTQWWRIGTTKSRKTIYLGHTLRNEKYRILKLVIKEKCMADGGKSFPLCCMQDGRLCQPSLKDRRILLWRKKLPCMYWLEKVNLEELMRAKLDKNPLWSPNCGVPKQEACLKLRTDKV